MNRNDEPVTTQAEIDLLYAQELILQPPVRENGPAPGQRIGKWLEPISTRIDQIHAYQEGEDLNPEEEEEVDEELQNVEADLVGGFRTALKERIRSALQRNGELGSIFCRYINAAGKPASVSTDAVLRFVGTNDCTEEMVDFMCSRAGLGLKPQIQKTDSSASRTLTVAQGRMLFGPTATVASKKKLVNDIKLHKLDYVLVPIVKNYHEPYERKISRVKFTHVYFVVLCGMRRGEDPASKMLIWADSMWYKTTPGNDEGDPDEYINHDRITKIYSKDHHLDIVKIRNDFVFIMKRYCSTPWSQNVGVNEVPCRFLRTTTYENHGCAIALFRSGMLLMRQPHRLIGQKQGNHGRPLGQVPVQPNTAWALLWRGCPLELADRRGGEFNEPLRNDENDGFTDVALATLILARQLIRAADRGVDSAPEAIEDDKLYKSYEKRGIPNDIPEDDIDFYFYPRILQEGWQLWLFLAQNIIDPRILFYAVYGEEFDPEREDHHFVRPLPPPRVRQRRQRHAFLQMTPRQRAMMANH